MSDLQAIARTIIEMAAPGMKPKELAAAVRRRHPDASKKDVSRAAFYATILAADVDPEHAVKVQDIALAARGGTDDDAETPRIVAPSAAARAKRRTRPAA